MGSGKTTLGKETAYLLQMPFVDLDAYIETKEKKTIEEIFANEGERAFREKEKIYLKDLVQLQIPNMSALGGGTVCSDENIQLVKNKGLLIYLELSQKDLAERLKKEKEKRPILKNVSDKELPEAIAGILKLRKKYYEQAHIKINALHLTASQLLNAILDFAQKNND